MYELPVPQTDAPGGRFDSALHWSQALSGMWTTGQTCRSWGGELGGSVWAHAVCLLRACRSESSPGLPHRAVVKMVGDYGEGWGSGIRYSLLCCGATRVVLLGVGKGEGERGEGAFLRGSQGPMRMEEPSSLPTLCFSSSSRTSKVAPSPADQSPP